MTASNAYKLLTATVVFRDAYTKLCKLYDDIWDADFSEQYPLGQIDLFNENTCKGITAWLNCQTTKLINSLPDRVINPACIECLLMHKTEKTTSYISPRVQTNGNGSCSIQYKDCKLYPYVVFDVAVIKQFLKAQDFDPTIKLEANVEYDDMALRVLYNKLLNNLHIQDSAN